MRRMIVAVLLAGGVAAGARAAVSADDVVGQWLTTDDRSTVEIVKEGDAYNGKIVALKTPLDETGKPKVDKNNPDKAKRSDPLLGIKLVWGFTYKGNGVWGGGRIYDPDNGKTYYCKLYLKGDKLTARGSLDPWGVAGRTVVWNRKPAEAPEKAEAGDKKSE
jgi:uncharacterized protein (DUF2147 family)